MKKPLLQLGSWAGLLGPSAPGNTRTATAALSPPQTINCVPALLAAFAICGLLGAISLLVPPFINWDWLMASWLGAGLCWERRIPSARLIPQISPEIRFGFSRYGVPANIWFLVRYRY